MTSDLVNPQTVPPVAVNLRLDPVRSRVHAEPQRTNFEILQAETAARQEASAPTMPEAPPTRRKTHPGDVLYWVACLGGVCLLLFTATK